MITLLRERVAIRGHQELVEFIDQLIPSFEISPDDRSVDREVRSTFHWSEFLNTYDEDFIRNAYFCLFRREPDISGMQSGLRQLRIEKCSRIELLGRLRYSSEGRNHAVVIEGLWIRYTLARVQRIPVLGALVGLVLNVGNLSRPDVRHEALQVRQDQRAETVTSKERAMAAHFVRVANQLDESRQEIRTDAVGDELGKLVQPALTQFLQMPGTEFVVSAYRVVLGRKPGNVELETALSKLMAGAESKTMMLGKLFDSKETQLSRNVIQGLPAAYTVERLFALPVIGFFLQLPRAVRFLSHANTAMEFQRRECETQMIHLEPRLIKHYNDSVKHLKLKLAELVELDSKG